MLPFARKSECAHEQHSPSLTVMIWEVPMSLLIVALMMIQSPFISTPQIGTGTWRKPQGQQPVEPIVVIPAPPPSPVNTQ
jgi:hypothetical protein